MEYVILGNGWIGGYLKDKLNAHMDSRRIETQKDADHIISDWEPSCVFINCIGKTGRPNIDWCEDNKRATSLSNILTPFYIAEACKRLGRYWIHVGSGCIYTGYQKEWTEDDAPNFYGSFYSATKAISQDILKQYQEVCVLRIRMPIDPEMSERSYLSKLLKYIKEGKSLFDMSNSMLYLPDLVGVVDALARQRLTGVFNVVNPGPLPASKLLKLYDPELKFRIENYETVRSRLKAPRSNCVLSWWKLRNEGIVLKPLKDRIAELKAR